MYITDTIAIGFGHATRVSAIVEAILDVNPAIGASTYQYRSDCNSFLPARVDICIVSTAPSYVFNCLSKGASYRYSQVDPVIVQPVAYAVDRRQSLEVLRDFLDDRVEKLHEEALWLRESNVDCVLSDAVFLAWYVAHPFFSQKLAFIGYTMTAHISAAATLTGIPRLVECTRLVYHTYTSVAAP